MSCRLPPPLTRTALDEFVWRPKAGSTRVFFDPEIEPLEQQNVSVYRYGSLPETLALIPEGQWRFKRPDAWDDPYEKHVGSCLFGAQGPFRRIRAYAKCFSFEYHSEPMWRLFGSADGLVRMTFKLRDLVNALECATHGDGKRPKLYVGRVRYMPQAAIRASVDQLTANPRKGVSRFAMHALLMKRNGFIFENEIRVCFLFSEEDEPEPTRMVGGVVPSIINDMLLDPYASRPIAQAWKRLLTEVHGAQCPIEQSKFNLDPTSFT